MADTTWTEEGPSEAPKKKIPTWIWFCGAGCLAMLVLGLIALMFGINFVKNATDPDRQWEEIAKILPYDERPPEMEPKFGMNMGIEQYMLQDSRGYQLQIQHSTGSQAREAREMLFEKDPPQFPKNMGVVGFEDVQAGTVEVQGREVHVVRMKLGFKGFAKSMIPKEGQDQLGAMMWADVTPEGRDDLVMLQMQRMKVRGKGDPATEGPITDAQLREVLKPFHVGPKR